MCVLSLQASDEDARPPQKKPRTGAKSSEVMNSKVDFCFVLLYFVFFFCFFWFHWFFLSFFGVFWLFQFFSVGFSLARWSGVGFCEMWVGGKIGVSKKL